MTKATLITRGGLGNIVVQHITLVEFGRRPYAQYKSAPFVKYKKKGGRKVVGFVDFYKPYIVILEGWQDIKTQEIFNDSYTNESGVKISSAKYMSQDERWQKDFEHATKLTGIIVDYRGVDTNQTV